MNSLEQLAMEKPKPPGPVQLASNWIEVFAIPIASSIMETQPIALALQLLVPTVTGDNSVQLLDTVTITLLMLGMQWWTMLVKYLVQRGMKESQSTILQVLGLILALVALVVTHLALLNHLFLLIIGVIMIGWFWKRALDRVRAGLTDEHLITAFKAGFIVLLGVLALAVIFPFGFNVLGGLALGLPLFFLSGMLALSFTRIGVIKRENASHPGSAPKSATNSWIAGLTVSWIAIVVIGLALEALPIQKIITMLTPIWELLGLIVNGIFYILGLILLGILYAIGFLVTALFSLFGRFAQGQNQRPKVPNFPLAQQAPLVQHAGGGAGQTIGRIVLVIVVLAVIGFAIYFARHKMRRVEDNSEEEEEVREGLDMNSILKARREERRRRRQKSVFELEALDPNSVRARYRDFLQTLSDKTEYLERRPNETPAEYQQRLQEQLNKAPAQEGETDPVILSELTRAYARERYGGKRTDDSEKGYLRTWVPHLVQRLTSSATPRRS